MSEVNPSLRDHLEALAARASLKGGNLWDVLNAAGLLFTEDRRRRERWHALSTAAEALESLSVPQLLGAPYAAGSTTALDMRRGCQEFLEARAEHAKEGKA